MTGSAKEIESTSRRRRFAAAISFFLAPERLGFIEHHLFEQTSHDHQSTAHENQRIMHPSLDVGQLANRQMMIHKSTCFTRETLLLLDTEILFDRITNHSGIHLLLLLALLSICTNTQNIVLIQFNKIKKSTIMIQQTHTLWRSRCGPATTSPL